MASSNFQMELRKISVIVHVRRRSRTWSFPVVILQRKAKKCTKIRNARAQPLFYSLNLLFSDVLVTVVVVVCFSSLIYGNESNNMLTFTTRPLPLSSAARKYFSSSARWIANRVLLFFSAYLKMKAVHEDNP